jgi:hypothetical protein
MIEYPKIETLYDRDEFHSVDTSKIRRKEFTNIKRWHITEKIDGTNVCVGLRPDGTLEFRGKTSDAQMPIKLFNYLNITMTPEIVQNVFGRNAETKLYPEVVIFGEGYGATVQKDGEKYNSGVSFAIFDVVVDRWWLSRANVIDVANKLGYLSVPELCVIDKLPTCEHDLTIIIGGNAESRLAHIHGKTRNAEGIVARTDPQLFYKDGSTREPCKPLMWKLKFKDFKRRQSKVKIEVMSDGDTA